MDIDLNKIEKQVKDSLYIEKGEELKLSTDAYFFSQEPQRFIDFIEIENYNKDLIIDIAKKYNLSLDSTMRWVSIRRQDAMKCSDALETIGTINKNEGFLIEELYDENRGFPFVYK